MTTKDLYGLRYFLGFAFILIGLFVYSGATGRKWIGGTKTEKEKAAPGRPNGVHTYPRYFYHK